jgi:3-oxoacyl-[acyl-carrier-protein] synthase II
MRRRVVVTGIGLVSPVGLDTPSTWEALLAGRSGIGPITKFDAAEYSCRIAGEVRGFDPERYMEKKDVRKMDTYIHYAVAASKEALDDAGYKIDAGNAERVGVYVGSGIGGSPTGAPAQGLMERGPRRISPFFIPGMIVNLASGRVSIPLRRQGPEPVGGHRLRHGHPRHRRVGPYHQDGGADAMLAGGTEAVISPLAVGGFCAMKALSTRNDAPEKASRPFDAERDGFVMGEGAGVLLLEEREAALARGARIYAELTGYGISGDAFHISAPAEDGEGAVRAMQQALQTAGARPEDVDYINAHGTSTPVGDRIETLAVKRVFGDHARKLVFASTKSMTGHLLGAAGGLESAVSVLALYHGKVPPTINQEVPDPECDLDCAANVARTMPVRAALNNSFGFGGTNASLLFVRHREASP